ncbi:hypothetical protein QUF58_08715 [Anaerolineales bacterium HSG24]|nr:hypothetical protein [Anaerolineales bacterium HSG24]
MPEQIFVGREKYIQTFREILSAPVGNPYILNLRGSGGMGKTKILERIVEICEKEELPNTGIIDFYNYELNSQISALELHIINKLANKRESMSFFNYQKMRQEFHNKRDAIRRQKLKEQFILDLTQWSQRKAGLIGSKRGVFIFDTFENIKNNIVGQRVINDWLPILNSSIVILSGRQKEGELEFPTDIANAVIDKVVETFTEDEAKKYLSSHDVWQAIVGDGMIEKCFEVTELRPLRLALSVDWLIQNNTGDVTPTNLFGREKEEFEYELVVGLEDVTKRPESVIIPYMAHLPRPFDVKLLEFLNLPVFTGYSSEALFANLSKLSFVKHTRDARGRDFYWFQDELRELYHKYIFKQSNRVNEIRIESSQKMLEFYDLQIKQASDVRDAQRYQARRLHHEIYLNHTEGIAHYRKLFQEARQSDEIGFTSMLIEAVRGLMDSFLDEEQIFSFRIDEARWLRDIGNAKLAQKRGFELLDQYERIPQARMHIYNALGGSTERLGDLNKALEFYTKSLELSKELGQMERLCLEEMNIGEVNRVMGKIKTAVENFDLAYEHGMKYNTADIVTVAKASSELGYTYALAGQPEIGLDYCNGAIDIVEGKDEYRSTYARFKVVRGSIYIMLFNYQKSKQDIEDAIDIYSQKNYLSHHALAQAYFELAFTQWLESDEIDDSTLQNTALQNFEISISFARDYNQQILHRALNQVSNIYWKKGNKTLAHKTNFESYRLAKEHNDIQYTIDSLSAMAEFDYGDNKYDKLLEYAQELENDFETKGYEYPLFYGRMKRILAEVAFDQGDYDNATNYYKVGLYQISKHRGHATIYDLRYELIRFENRLHSILTTDSLKICQQLKKYWIQQEEDRLNSKLISWVTRLINRFTFQTEN